MFTVVILVLCDLEGENRHVMRVDVSGIQDTMMGFTHIPLD